jgi:hypothetical protein
VLVTLDTPYADTTAADLRFALDLPELPALATLTLDTGPHRRLELRLLGASHQVVLHTPAGRLTETVACLPAAADGLPRRLVRPDYAFRAEIRRLRGTLNARALAGEFPGSPDALTVIAAEGTTWWTVHAYPQSGEIVRTRTEAGE